MDNNGIIYNVTIKISAQVAEQWLPWLHEEYINPIIGTGCFADARVLRLLETDDAEGPTYAVQFYTEQMSGYERYKSEYMQAFEEKFYARWGGQFVWFGSLMAVVD